MDADKLRCQLAKAWSENFGKNRGIKQNKCLCPTSLKAETETW